MSYGFSLLDADVLKEVANIGASNAATSLSKLLNRRIGVTLPVVDMPEFKNLSDFINGAESLIAGLLVCISGDIDGMIMYITPEHCACNLIRALMGRERSSFTEFDELDISALTEIGNILISSYLTSLSTLMNFTIKQSVPYMSIDMAGAIFSVPAIEFGKVGNNVLLIKSTFNEKDDLSGYFVLVPNAEKDVKF